MTNNKTTIRYIRFRSATNGGRTFDFSVSGTVGDTLFTCFEIPAEFFAGIGRIQLQEGAGICYAKLKDMIEANPSAELPSVTCITASDLAHYRVIPHTRARR